jgi:transposase InsO family protein
VAHSLTVWRAISGTESRFIEPGSHWQNGVVESFNGKLRAEFLNAEVFHNLAGSQLKLRLFQRFYNEVRPHSSYGYLTPATYRRISQESKNKEELFF